MNEPIRGGGDDTDDAWCELFEQLAIIARPLLDAGWKLVGTDTDSGWEAEEPAGRWQSVFYDLERGGRQIELEYTSGDFLIGYPLDGPSSDDELTEELFQIPADPDAVLTEFREQGWL